MLAVLFALSLQFGDGSPAAPEPAPPACAHDREALLALDFKAFDQDLEGGWRPLGNSPACEAAGAELIAAYRQRNASRLTDEQTRGLKWHEAQLRAAQGEYARAADLMTEARADSPALDDRLYAVATIAYLRRDRPALLDARAKLAALAKPDWFDEAVARHKAQYGDDIAWPPNLDVVDGLVACFDKPYRDAYSFDCRPPSTN